MVREKLLKRTASEEIPGIGKIVIRKITTGEMLGMNEVKGAERFYRKVQMTVLEEDGATPVFEKWEDVRDADYDAIDPIIERYNKFNSVDVEASEKN